jgi:tetrapyrrole methylase family protein/MazG family protein
MARLRAVMATLREPGGCPWDREQTHRSLVPYLIEEAYELVEAIEHGSAEGLREELGDVLLQVIFHARIAEERGAFAFSDVAGALADKLEARHPHVFAGEHVAGAEAVSRLWHERKMAHRRSALDGIPSTLPALAWAGKVAARAARSGFEWNGTGDILAKTAEELAEFRAELEARQGTDPARQEALETEFGDLLFALVQLARWTGIEPETALRRSIRKFIARFSWMEESLRARGLSPESRTPAEWEALWRQAKEEAALPGAPPAEPSP